MHDSCTGHDSLDQPFGVVTMHNALQYACVGVVCEDCKEPAPGYTLQVSRCGLFHGLYWRIGSLLTWWTFCVGDVSNEDRFIANITPACSAPLLLVVADIIAALD